MSFLKPISISMSPNTETDDVFLAFRLIFQPWLWLAGRSSRKLEKEFKDYFKSEEAVAFNSGRSALFATLKSLGIGKGDEVIIQAFTCNSAVNPVLAVGAKAVFVDIDETLNIDATLIEKNITSRTKAVMVQHNFGCPANMKDILKIVKDHNLYLIEDTAHALGARYDGKLCGTFGDAAFFSLGRDKIISSVFGGIAVTFNKKTGNKLRRIREDLKFPSAFWVLQQLLHPVLMNWLILPLFGINAFLGRIFLGAFHKLMILSKAVYKVEKKGKLSGQFPAVFPEGLALLGLKQFGKLERFNKHRKELAGFYKEELKSFNLPLANLKEELESVFMRFPVLLKGDTDKLLEVARKKGIFLDDGWRKIPLVPLGTDLKRMGYTEGSCKNAEKVSVSILNLPTHINVSKKDAGKITEFLKNYEGRGN